MQKNDIANNMMGDQKQKKVQTNNLYIQGHLLRWENVIIQISNISLITAANVSSPRLPGWVLAAALIGLICLPFIWYIGLILMIAAGITFYIWYENMQRAKTCKYLNILMNSGYTYSILFQNNQFLGEVLQVFANIFEDGAAANTNYYIDLNNCKIDNKSCVVSTAGNEG